ncbi:NAD(+)/NADH kinase [Thermodesulfobacterium sp. TA1]|uniref:NAD(+)/NADH kinase n=1 Tax=Thermodesulfobacterium sp. TA1 TaxID=2234087 RepID=UPI00123204FE|nr:NAD(+)/NADH kinase [Thermodesulfobacterium sp. TA1]QER42888.1 NAD(+)/NADH kinase [Thermodesulfobacterium sp. TA1]
MLKLFYLIKDPQKLQEVLEKIKRKETFLVPLEKISDLPLEEVATFKAILVLGGDGTFLRAVPYAYEYDLPLIGVNLGNFGFLTEICLEELPVFLTLLEKGEVRIQERTLLEITYENQTFIALNEGAIMKGPLGKVIYLSLQIENCFLTNIPGDGLIISTPTGSTAYNLSAGGPVIHPEAKVFVCTPICAFKINLRPFVIPDHFETVVVLHKKREGKNEEVHLLIDGQTNLVIREDEPLRFKKAPKPLKIFSLSEKNYLNILKSKFNW